MSEINALIEKLQAATGPDQEMDASVLSACGLRVERAKDGTPYLVFTADMEWRWPGHYTLLPNVSGSIDAAIALVEKMLPGWVWVAESREPVEPLPFRGAVYGAGIGFEGYAQSAPIALLIALLSALASVPALSGDKQ